MISSDSPYIKNVTFFLSEERMFLMIIKKVGLLLTDRFAMYETDKRCLIPYNVWNLIFPVLINGIVLLILLPGFVIQYDITTRDTIKPCRVSHRLALKNRIPFNTFSSNVKNIAIRHFQRHQNFFSGNKDEKNNKSNVQHINYHRTHILSCFYKKWLKLRRTPSAIFKK